MIKDGRKLGSPEKLIDGGNNRPGVDHLVGHHFGFRIQKRHAFFDGSFQTKQPVTESDVSDQLANPTFCRDLPHATALLNYGFRGRLFAAFDEARGVYHVAGEGGTSRFELARAILELDSARAEHKVRSLEPIASTEFPAAAARPAQATLDCARFAERFGIRLPPWRESLQRALADWPLGVLTTSEGRR